MLPTNYSRTHTHTHTHIHTHTHTHIYIYIYIYKSDKNNQNVKDYILGKLRLTTLLVRRIRGEITEISELREFLIIDIFQYLSSN